MPRNGELHQSVSDSASDGERPYFAVEYHATLLSHMSDDVAYQDEKSPCGKGEKEISKSSWHAPNIVTTGGPVNGV